MDCYSSEHTLSKADFVCQPSVKHVSSSLQNITSSIYYNCNILSLIILFINWHLEFQNVMIHFPLALMALPEPTIYWNLQFLNHLIIIKTMILPPRACMTVGNFGYHVWTLWCSCSLKTFNLFGFLTFWHWAYLMKIFTFLILKNVFYVYRSFTKLIWL